MKILYTRHKNTWNILKKRREIRIKLFDQNCAPTTSLIECQKMYTDTDTLNALKWKTILENNDKHHRELCLELTLIVVLRMDSNSYPHCQDLGSNTQSQIIALSDNNNKK